MGDVISNNWRGNLSNIYFSRKPFTKNFKRVKTSFKKIVAPVLCFDDISQPVDNYILPDKKHILEALEFAGKIGNGSLLIHCFAGVSRSSGIALAIIALNYVGGMDSLLNKLSGLLGSEAIHNNTLKFIPPVPEESIGTLTFCTIIFSHLPFPDTISKD